MSSLGCNSYIFMFVLLRFFFWEHWISVLCRMIQQTLCSRYPDVYFRKKNHKNKFIKISASQLKGKQIMEKSYLREHMYSHNPVDENSHILSVFLPWCILGNIETIKQNIDHHSSCASSKSARCICNLCSHSIELQ